MKLVCQSQKIGDVALIRCDGRIVFGEEAQSLQVEIEKYQLETKKFVLQLAEVTYLDSGGLGVMVRFLGRLRAARGDLKLCQLSPFVLKVFEATNLKSVFQTFATEREAIASFSRRPQTSTRSSGGTRPRVICVDSSSDLLAYLSALLKRCNYEVHTATLLSDAATLVCSTHPRLAICGPTTQASPSAFEKFRHADPQMQIFLLPSDFRAAEAGEAGLNLLERIQTLLKMQP